MIALSPPLAARVSSWGRAISIVVVALVGAAPAVAGGNPDDDVLVIVDDAPATDKSGAFVFGGAPAPAQKKASDDDDALVIVDDAPTVDENGAIILGGGDDDDDDELIIIVDDDTTPLPTAARASGPLGRTWESWHIALDTELFAAAQAVGAEDGTWRVLGSGYIESWLLPAQNLGFYGTALGRVAYDGTPEGRASAFLDLYELYAKISVDRATVNLGRLVIPWGRTLGTGFGDRLHPPDVRRGAPFPDPARAKQPQLGVQVKGSLDIVGVEGVAFVSYDKTEGSLAASNQGGARLGRYQTALVRAPGRVGGLLVDEDTAKLRPDTVLAEPTLAARAWRRVGELDLTTSVAWHFDETPTLNLSPEVRRALASEAHGLLGVVSLPPPGPPCGDDVSLGCVGDKTALTYGRTTSIAVDGSWGLGLVVVRAEAVAFPRLANTGGKTAVIVDALGLRSVQVSQWAAAVAVEGQLGPAVDGSLELFNVQWDGVPSDARLWGVEVLDDSYAAEVDAADVGALRTVNRLAASAHLGGAFLEDKILWKLRGEAGILQPDVLLSAELKYRLPVFDLYVGGRGDLFTGLPGSPGWMRQDASLLGVFLGEGA